ncbi:UNVERIFIED_CONTAM: hypothetical protein Sangu_1722300 [Sesamum angustifolium]|uniref:Uncharacterized protein n=1 Tax=Sesamum angustifolium TaxID=2727405 RepID=A0AAW2MLU6_9LAMI
MLIPFSVGSVALIPGYLCGLLIIPLFLIEFFGLIEAFCQQKGQSLRLTEKEGVGVVIQDRLWATDSDNHQLFLMGRLLSSEQPRFEVLVSFVKSILNPVKGLEMRQLAEGHFLI